jgi:hypothetical protein
MLESEAGEWLERFDCADQSQRRGALERRALTRRSPSARCKGNRRFARNGTENGKSAYLVQRRAAGTWITVASIVYGEEDWILRYASSGRIERFAALSEAKDTALKI